MSAAEFILEEPLELVVEESLAGSSGLVLEQNPRAPRPKAPKLYGGYEKLLVRTALERVNEYSSRKVVIAHHEGFQMLVRTLSRRRPDATMITIGVDGKLNVRGIHYSTGTDFFSSSLKDGVVPRAIASLIMTSSEACFFAVHEEFSADVLRIQERIECVVPVQDHTYIFGARSPVS